MGSQEEPTCIPETIQDEIVPATEWTNWQGEDPPSSPDRWDTEMEIRAELAGIPLKVKTTDRVCAQCLKTLDPRMMSNIVQWNPVSGTWDRTWGQWESSQLFHRTCLPIGSVLVDEIEVMIDSS